MTDHRLLSLLVTGVLVAGCESLGEPNQNVVASIDVTPTVDTIAVLGETHSFTAVARNAAAQVIPGKTFTWTSDDPMVAVVDSAGRVTAMGNGSAAITAAADGATGVATVVVVTDVLTITAGPTTPRQGDVVTYVAVTRDEAGVPIGNAPVVWTVDPPAAGVFADGGTFVGYVPGPAHVVATGSGLSDTLSIQIQARGLAGSLAVVGQGAVTDRFTSDLWVYGSHAYTGTWGTRTTGAGSLRGDRLYVWDLSNPAAPALTDSVTVDASTVNDVKVRDDGTLAIITHEGAADRLNGITLLDLTDPAHPTVITRFTDGLEGGIHNVWIDGDFVYAAEDGSGSVRIVDISTPASPAFLTSFRAPIGFVHDVYVRDGLAFLSHWDAGLVIVDVGNGVAGGSPGNPVEVSRFDLEGVEVHNTWYWPAGGYAFLGDETSGGMMHVVDVTDLSQPVKVADFRVPGAAPHNFWLDQANAVLYLAWYEKGLRMLDVSGALLGRLDLQGREIASSEYGAGGGCLTTAATCTWAPQLQDGLVYLSDMNTGLWVLQPGN